jgi:hypothetical protein
MSVIVNWKNIWTAKLQVRCCLTLVLWYELCSVLKTLLWLWTAEQQCSAFTLMYAQVQYRIVLPCSFTGTSISFLITLHNIHFITYFWEYRFYNGHSLINLLIYWLMFNANLSCIMISNVVRNSHMSIYIYTYSILFGAW